MPHVWLVFKFLVLFLKVHDKDVDQSMFDLWSDKSRRGSRHAAKLVYERKKLLSIEISNLGQLSFVTFAACLDSPLESFLAI